MEALGFANVFVNYFVSGTKTKKAVVNDVLHVPKLTCNLFSVRAAVAKGLIIVVSVMQVERSVGLVHWVIACINCIVKLSLLDTPL